LFCGGVIGLALVGELNDIELCSLARERAGDALSPRMGRALTVVSWMRRWI
jgi:hypothetical protein